MKHIKGLKADFENGLGAIIPPPEFKDSILEKISELQRQATCHKDAKDWDSAIDCLRKSEQLTKEIDFGFSMATYLRLPLFLQKAGRFDDAMQEFERLLGKIDQRIKRQFSHKGAKVRRKLAHAERATTYEKMALVCKRQKLPEMAAKYRALENEHRQTHARLMRETDAEEEKELAAFAQRRAARRPKALT